MCIENWRVACYGWSVKWIACNWLGQWCTWSFLLGSGWKFASLKIVHSIFSSYWFLSDLFICLTLVLCFLYLFFFSRLLLDLLSSCLRTGSGPAFDRARSERSDWWRRVEIGGHSCMEGFLHALQNSVYYHVNLSVLFVSLWCVCWLPPAGSFPIDTTKTRLQIQGQKLDARFSDVKYKGMFHAFKLITKEEGFLALYSGWVVAIFCFHPSRVWFSFHTTSLLRLGPAVLRQSTYGTIKFGVYYTLKKWIASPDQEDMMTNIFCGIVAGSASSAIANPTDVLKVRMQACCSSLSNKSMFACFREVYQQEGLAGLWKVTLHADWSQ